MENPALSTHRDQDFPPGEVVGDRREIPAAPALDVGGLGGGHPEGSRMGAPFRS
jgi:hypothetical protein